MKLTCVTATFNCVKAGNRESLIRCIESVAQLKTEHEHLIYDGASTDGTAKLLYELEKKTPCLKVVSEPDTGIYNALNKGVRDAKGEWFYVLGADDYICASKVLDVILTTVQPDVDVIIAPVERDRNNVFFKQKKDLAKIFCTVPYSHQGMVMKTEHVRTFGGFDELSYHICADWDMMLKAHDKALHFFYTYEAFAFYKAGGLSESDKECWKEVTKVIQNHVGLNDIQVQHLKSFGFQPLHIMFRYLFHKDYAYRIGAKAMIKKWLKYYFRKIIGFPISGMRKS